MSRLTITSIGRIEQGDFKGIEIKTDIRSFLFLISATPKCNVLFGNFVGEKMTNFAGVDITGIEHLPNFSKKAQTFINEFTDFEPKKMEIVLVHTSTGTVVIHFMNQNPGDGSICKFTEWGLEGLVDKEIEL